MRIEPLTLEEDNSVGDFLTADLGEQWRTGEREVDLRIENPWAGDTETGFGRDCHVSLTREHAERLRDWLTTALENWDAE